MKKPEPEPEPEPQAASFEPPARRLLRALHGVLTGPQGRPSYWLTRFVFLRALGLVYLVAFLTAVFQLVPLIGGRGLLPVGPYLDRAREHFGSTSAAFLELPSIFWLDHGDGTLLCVAIVGAVLSALVLAGLTNALVMLALWFLYMSIDHVGQRWYSFGWETQLLETGLIAVFLCPLLGWRPLSRRHPPPRVPVYLLRWLIVRIMLGAGLIKLRGDPCWVELTCLETHFETQPIPNPLSLYLHHLPAWALKGGVLMNHVVELVAPLFAFGPRRARHVAGALMVLFQVVLIVSGNLSFLNWLTILPCIACFDDQLLRRALPGRWRARFDLRYGQDGQDGQDGQAGQEGQARHDGQNGQDGEDGEDGEDGQTGQARQEGQARHDGQNGQAGQNGQDGQDGQAGQDGQGASDMPHQPARAHRYVTYAFAALVAYLSLPVVGNLAGAEQAMNRSFDRLHIVNTYGAFGSVGRVRHELVIEGTDDPSPDDAADWREYAFKCKPGDPRRRPCVITPYHYRLDWLIWFAALDVEHRGGLRREDWVIHLVYKLLAGDEGVLSLMGPNPFPDGPPRHVRVLFYRYRFAAPGDEGWWERERLGVLIPPVSLDNPQLRAHLRARGWLPAPRQ